MFQATHQALKKGAVLLIQGYRLIISPFLGERCRFYPSCSAYSHFAFQHYSFFQALCCSFKRLLKCHPWHPGGFDYPPGFPSDDLHKD
jgi:uncharacterized protein